MSTRTQFFKKIPWSGGLNSAVDPGVLPDGDLVTADNVVFGTSGSRLRREGFSYFDLESAIPAVSYRWSTGTTRTLVFATELTTAAPVNNRLVAGERINVTTTATSGNEYTYYLTSTATITSIGSRPAKDFAEADVNVTTNIITETAHQYVTGLKGQFTTTTTLPAGLSLATDYYLIVVTADTYKVATSAANATAGTAIDITDDGTGTHTFTPTTLDTIVYTGSGSLSEGTAAAAIATSTATVARRTDVLAIHDYWRSDASYVKVQRPVAATDQGKVFFYDSSGRRNLITNAGTALATGNAIINTEVMNDVLILAFDLITNTPKRYRPETSADLQDLGGSPPDFSLMRLHQSRLWANDKTNKDRLHYSSPGNPEEWQGAGDSGAVDIGVGDGDPNGITAIFPPFKGSLFVAKGNKLYEVVGDSPENYRPEPITNGLGAVSHKSATAVDLDDVFFISRRGIHSLQATAGAGDQQGQFLSAKIQNTFNDFDQARQKYMQSVYLPNYNAVALAVTEGSGGSTNTDVYFFNTQVKEWYRWPDINCQTLTVYRNASNITTLLIGDNAGRIITTQNGTFSDYGSSGADFKIKTGMIYPDGDPHSVKAFKNIGFLFKPVGDFQFTVTIKIDNYPSQSVSFAQSASGDLLGTTFVLGSSTIGNDNVLAPYMRPIDGIGHGCTLTIEQNGANQQVELYGVIIEYEQAEFSQEVNEGE